MPKTTQTRRDFLRSLGVGAASALTPSALLAGEAGRPNIVFIFADDWGWGDLACYGHGQLETPHLDRLAAEGVLFRQFYVSAAVCSPSRASAMTGRFTSRHGIHSHLRQREFNLRRGMPAWLGLDQPLLPKLLKQAGYATAHFGKWHLTSPDDRAAPAIGEYGFDAHKTAGGYGDGICRMPRGAPGWNLWEDARRGYGQVWDRWRSRASGLIFDEAIAFIEANRDRPFYVQAWLYDTHGRLTTTDEQKAPFKDLPPKLQVYAGAVHDSDRHVGRLMKKLAELGLDENTIVIFSSDNGPEDGRIGNVRNHGGAGSTGGLRGRKRSGYEGGIRTPFIVRWPGGTPAGKVDETTVLAAVDLLPTLCSLAGAEAPPSEAVDGLDMSAALRGKPTQRGKPLFWDLRESVVGPEIERNPKLIIRDGNWKLLTDHDGGRAELYDIAADPKETADQAGRQPKLVERLKRKLLAWRDRYKLPTDVPRRREEAGGGKKVALNVRKAHKAFKEKVTFRLTVRAANREQVRNGFLVFGNGAKVDQLMRAGVYIGAGAYSIQPAGLVGTGRGAEKQADFDAAKTFKLLVVVDVRQRRVEMTVDGRTKLSAPLSKSIDRITHYGTATTEGAKSSFSKVEINGQ